MKQDLSSKKTQIVFGNDSVVIQKYISGIKGGRTLDVTGFTPSVINAGHVIITDGKGLYKPMPVTGSEGAYTYASLPGGYSYAGVLYRSIATNKPAASIMTWGEVCEDALPVNMSTIMEAFKAACPHIDFIKDEEA